MQVKVIHKRQKGVGDVIEDTLSFFGIGKTISNALSSITKKPCGCAERKESLNKIPVYGTKQYIKVLR